VLGSFAEGGLGLAATASGSGGQQHGQAELDGCSTGRV
jgi:hypothetical protein